mgnify:CR=1 FL=1
MRTEITEDLVMLVACRKAIGLTNRSIILELGLTRYYLDKALSHPLYTAYLGKSLETVAAALGGWK